MFYLFKFSGYVRETKKLIMHNSFTKFVKWQDSLSTEGLKRKNPHYSSSKSTTSHVFEKQTETCLNYGVEKCYESTTFVGQTNKVCALVHQLID